MKTTYLAEGIVEGKLWGGGGGGYYPAKRYSDVSLAKLKAEIKEDFKSGKLDSGMGFEHLTGAWMSITKREMKSEGKKKWVSLTHSEMKFGTINVSDAIDAYNRFKE